MNKSIYSKLNTILAILVIILGIIHNIATFTPLVLGGLGCVQKEVINAVIFLSLGTGTATFLSGVLLLLLKGTINNSNRNGAYSLLLVTLFLLVLSIIAVVCTSPNPFAYIMLGIAACEMIVVIKLVFLK